MNVGIYDYSDLFPEAEHEQVQKGAPDHSRKHMSLAEMEMVPLLPTAPAYYDQNGMAVFSRSQIDWGWPEDFGFHERYLVVEQEWEGHPPMLSWHEEKQLRDNKRPPHRYCRRERFKTTLKHLMAFDGHVPKSVLNLIRPHVSQLRQMPRHEIWNFIRNILKKTLRKKKKHHKIDNYKIYYNRIPIILAELNIIPMKQRKTAHLFDKIQKDFEKLHRVWPHTDTGRKYFIQLRYVALRLMQQYNIEHEFNIPLARTIRKKTALDQIYQKLWEQVLVEEVESCLDDLPDLDTASCTLLESQDHP